MKRSEIEKQLYSESETHLPDVYDAVMTAADEQGLFAEKKTVKRKSNRSFWIRAAATFAAAAACCAIIIPSVVLSGGNGIQPVVTGKTPALSSAAETFGLGAVTTVRLVGSEFGGTAQTSVASASLCRESEDAVKAQAENFNRYFSMLESFLGDERVSSEISQNTEEEYSAYSYKLTVTGYGFDGSVVDYLMYYNEIVLKDDSSPKSTEQEITFEGVMVYGGKEYALEGKRSYKEEKDESEEEFEIRAYPDIADSGTYVKMEQEVSYESGEMQKEYVYGLYEKGGLVEQTCVEFRHEEKGGKQETQLQIEFRQGSAKGSYKLERAVKDGYEVMQVKYSLDGESGNFYIRTTQDGRYEYDFSDGTKKYFDIIDVFKEKTLGISLYSL